MFSPGFRTPPHAPPCLPNGEHHAGVGTGAQYFKFPQFVWTATKRRISPPLGAAWAPGGTYLARSAFMRGLPCTRRGGSTAAKIFVAVLGHQLYRRQAASARRYSPVEVWGKRKWGTVPRWRARPHAFQSMSRAAARPGLPQRKAACCMMNGLTPFRQDGIAARVRGPRVQTAVHNPR
jgi:hypothetical protein